MNKRSLIIIAILVVAIGAAVPTVLRMFAGSKGIAVFIDAADKPQKLDMKAAEKDGELLFSFKDIKRCLGVQIQYSEADGKLTLGGKQGAEELKVDPGTLETIDGDYYIPISTFASALGYDYTVGNDGVHLGSNPNAATKTPTGKFTLATPYANASDIKSIPWVYSEKNADQPWGTMTYDMRLLPSGELVPFQAVADGTVEDVYAGVSKDVEYNKVVQITIRLDPNYVVRYVLNPASALPEELEVQQRNVFVAKGQKVKQGDILGKLHNVNVSSNVAFALIYAEQDKVADYLGMDKLTFVSPAPYFTEEARQSLLAVLNKDHVGWKLEYKTASPTGGGVLVYKDNARITFDHPCIVKNGELLAPFTALSQIGAEASYDEKTKEVVAKFAEFTVRAPVETIKKVQYIPLGTLLKGFGLQYGFDGSMASFSTKGYMGEYNRIVSYYDAAPCSFHDSPLTLVDGYFYIGSTHWDQYPSEENRFMKLDANLKKVWEYPMGKLSMPSAACCDSKGNVYYVATEELARLDPKNKYGPAANYLYSLTPDGQLRWRQKISDNNTKIAGGGLIGCAISADDTIYVGRAGLYAFDTSGNVKWHYTDVLANSWMYSNTAPVIDTAGNVYFVASDFSLASMRETGQRVICFAPNSGGKPKWVTTIHSQMDGGESTVAGSCPALTRDESHIVVVTGDTVHSLATASGKLVWQLKPFEGRRGIFHASPILDDKDNIYINTKSDDSSTIYAIKADGSGLLWTTNKVGSDLYGTGALGDDRTLYITSEPQTTSWYTFHAIDLATGEFKYQIGAPVIPMVNLTGVIIQDGYAYIAANAPQEAHVVKIKIDANGYLPGAAWPCYHGSNESTGRKAN